MNSQEIRRLESAAQRCDDHGQYLREMREVERLKAFAECRDIHAATAAEVFGTPVEKVSNDQRRSAKAINFRLIYGMSTWGREGQP